MKIIRLEAENIQRLNAVEIEPDGSLVVIGGQNMQGKTSVLDSILMALGGKSTIPKVPIHKGAKKGIVMVDLGELKITRTFTDKGSQLKVENAEGARYGTPQSILDALVGKLSFDPLEFSRMKPDKQLDVLRELVGVDFTEHDSKRQGIFDTRREVNRDGKALAARVAALPEYTDAPEKEVSVTELMKKLNEQEESNSHSIKVRGGLADCQEEHVIAKKELVRLQIECEELASEEKIWKAKVNKLPVDYDVQLVCDEISGAEEVNNKIRAMRQRQKQEVELNKLRKQSQTLTDQLAEMDEIKQSTMAAAKFPIAGLGMDEDGVVYKELPFAQASSAEALRVSVAIGLAMNPKLKVLLIRDGSLLDEENLILVAEMAEKYDAQVWIERVGQGEECSVIIEDGRIIEDDKE